MEMRIHLGVHNLTQMCTDDTLNLCLASSGHIWAAKCHRAFWILEPKIIILFSHDCFPTLYLTLTIKLIFFFEAVPLRLQYKHPLCIWNMNSFVLHSYTSCRCVVGSNTASLHWHVHKTTCAKTWHTVQMIVLLEC